MDSQFSSILNVLRSLGARMQVVAWLKNPMVRAVAALGVLLSPQMPVRAAAPAPVAPSAHSFSITGWDTERGLPSNAVLDVLQASDGYIWVASYQGLIRFDGLTFKMFTQEEIPGLTRASFWGIIESPKGTIWAATESDGLVRYRDGQWKIFKSADGLKSDKTTFLTTGENGDIWLGSRHGVVRVTGDRVEKIPAPDVAPEPNVTAMAFADHKLFIGTAAAGMLEWADGHYRQFRVSDGLSDDRITGLFVDRDGALWIGAYGKGIMRMRDGRFTRLADSGSNPPTRVNRFFQSADGVIWVAAENGLFRVEGDRVEEIRQANGRQFVQLESIRADNEGDLWIGSRQTGLYRLREPSFETLAQGKGLENELIYAIEPDGADGLWVGSLHGLVHATPKGNTVYNGWIADKGEDLTRDVLRDPNGDVWAATNGGLIQLHNGKSRLYNQKDGLADDRCRTLLLDGNGDLWVGTFNGLSRLHDGKFQNFGPTEGLNDTYILSLFLDSHHVVWVGTQSEGAFRFTGSRFEVAPAQLSQEPVFRMTENDGVIWAGTSRGLVRLKDGHTHRFTMREGLPGNTIFQAIDDGHGDLWVTGPWGVARVLKSSLEDVVSGREKMIIAKQFGRGDGLTAREVSSVSKSWIAPDGRIYFSTPNGVSVLRPDRLRANPAPPRVYVEQVIGDDQEYDRTAGISMPPGTRHLEFHYAAPSFASPESMRFRYRLVGFDTDWVEAGSRRSAYYTNLGPGNYTFEVMARNEDGLWSAAAAQAAFTVDAYFYQTRWFIALCVFAVVGLALAAHKIRIKAVQFAVRHQWLENLSMNDELTGLRNRRGFLLLADQQMRISERTKQAFDVVFIDLDRLKKINDEFGHAMGDQAIKDTAELLKKTFRDSDIICRYGGDEFAAIVIDESKGAATRPERVQAPCDRLHAAVREFNEHTGRPYRLSLSTGMSHYDPEIPTTLQAMLESADLGMYAEKRGRN